MINKLKHMEMMHSMCQQEALLLQRNLERFLLESENMRQLLTNGNRFSESNGQNIYAVIAYDTYMSHLSAVSNMARKFNIQLQLHSLSKSISRSAMIRHEVEFENIHEEMKNFNDAKSFDIDYTALHLECTYAKNPGAIESTTDQVSTENDISADVISCNNMFAGCNLEDQEPNKCLRDLSCFAEGFEFSGIITCVESYKDLTFYISTLMGNKEIPSKAIKCALFGISSNNDAKHEHLVAALQQRILKHTVFKVVYKQDRLLHLEILDDLISDYALSEMQPNYTDSNMFDVKDKVCRLPIKLSSSTECMNPFYDNFPVEKIVTWKDEKEAQKMNESNETYLDIHVKSKESCTVPKEIVVKSVSTVLITVTHIQSATCFYGQIETTETAEQPPVYWTDDSIRTKQKLLKSPEVGDLVLAQYPSDQLWYRAKIARYEAPKKFTVFYVDYGNQEQVSIDCLVKYDNSYLDVDGPFRCVCCRLADIVDITIGDERRQNLAKQLLTANLIYQKFNVEVLHLGLNDKLVIRILDSEFADVPDILLQLGYVRKVCRNVRKQNTQEYQH